MKNDISYAGADFPIANILNESSLTTNVGTTKRIIHTTWNAVCQDDARLIMRKLKQNRTGELVLNDGRVKFNAYYKPGASCTLHTCDSESDCEVTAVFEEM